MAVSINGSVLSQNDLTGPTPSTLTFTSVVLTAGDIVLIVVNQNAPANAPSSTAPTGGTGLSWSTAIDQANTASHFTRVTAYWSKIPSDQTSTLTVSTTAGGGDCGSDGTLYRLSGADQVTPVGLTDGFQGQTDPTGTDLQLIGTLAGSMIFMAGADWSAGTAARTITISNTTGGVTDRDNLESGQFRSIVARGDRSGSTNQGTLDYTAATGDWAAVIFEIEAAPAAGVVPTARPGKTWKRRFHHQQELPTGLAGAVPAAASAFVPSPSRPRWRSVALRRAESVTPVLTQIAAPVAPNFLQDPGRHDLRGLLLRRGRITTVPIPQISSPPPTGPRRAIRARLRRPAATVATPQATVPDQRRFRRVSTGFRRPRIVTPVSVQQVAPTPPPYPVWIFRVHRTLTGQRRSEAVTPVPAQITPPPPPSLPLWTFRVRRTLTGLRRSEAVTPVPVQQVAPAAPPYVPQLKVARKTQTAPRRGRIAVPNPTVTPVPDAVTRRRFTLPGKRRQQVGPVPPQIVVVPPTYPKQPVRRRIVALLLRRPGRQRAPVPPQVGPPPVIDANGRVVVTQTVASIVDGGGTAGLVGVTQTSVSTASGSPAAGGTTRVDSTADGRAEVG